MASPRVTSGNIAPAFRRETSFQTVGTIICIASPLIAALGLFLHFYQGVAISKEAMWGIVGGSSALLCFGIWARFRTQNAPLPQVQAKPQPQKAPLPSVAPLPSDPHGFFRRQILDGIPSSVEELRKLIHHPQARFSTTFLKNMWTEASDLRSAPSRSGCPVLTQILGVLFERYHFDAVPDGEKLPLECAEALLGLPNPPQRHLDELLYQAAGDDRNLALVERLLKARASPTFTDRDGKQVHALSKATVAPQITQLLTPTAPVEALKEALINSMNSYRFNNDVIKHLLHVAKQKIEATELSHFLREPLEEACARSTTEVVQWLIDSVKGGVENNDRSEFFKKSLCNAYTALDSAKVQLLISAGATPLDEHFQQLCKYLLKKDHKTFTGLSENHKNLLKPLLPFSRNMRNDFEDLLAPISRAHHQGGGWPGEKGREETYNNVRANMPKLIGYIESLVKESAAAV